MRKVWHLDAEVEAEWLRQANLDSACWAQDGVVEARFWHATGADNVVERVSGTAADIIPATIVYWFSGRAKFRERRRA